MLWQIFARRARAEEEYASECYAAGIIAVGWNWVGDLRQYASREELKERMRPEYKGWDQSLSANAGSLWLFANDVNVGDLVICPDDRRKWYYVGEVRSNYFYEHEADDEDPCPFGHRREVNWLGGLPRSDAEQIWPGGRIGPVQTLARVRRGEDSLRRLLDVRARKTPGRVSARARSRPDSN